MRAFSAVSSLPSYDILSSFAQTMESEVSQHEGSNVLDPQGRSEGDLVGADEETQPQLPWTPKPNKVRWSNVHTCLGTVYVVPALPRIHEVYWCIHLAPSGIVAVSQFATRGTFGTSSGRQAEI